MEPALGKADIAARLRQAGAMLRFRGESIHRARAYEAGADTLDAFAGDFGRLIEEQRLADLPGIGHSLASTITDLARDGRSAALERIMGGLPVSLLELARLPGFTSRRIHRLHEELGVATVDEVRAALQSGAAADVKGLGPRVAAKLLEALARAASQPGLVIWPEALRWAVSLASYLREARPDAQVEVTGPVRRCVETVSAVDLVAASPRSAGVVDALARHPAVANVVERSGRQCVLRLTNGLTVAMTVGAPERFGAALARTTGSSDHVAALERRAARLGVDPWSVRGDDEALVYAALELPLIPPELREGRGEIEAAANGDNFGDMVTFEDLRGAVHCHTVYSDGRDTVADMAKAAERLGLDYLTITDHSPAAPYAGGLTSDRIHQQWEEIAAVQPTTRVALLRGAECDILRDGALDHAADDRRALDCVIASVHERHKLDAAAATERLVRAMSTPELKIWGHPLGRLLLRRDPIACDVERVFDAIASNGSAIEINGSPWRLDLPPDLIPAARARGIKFVVSADAHSAAELEYLRNGVAMARRGGLRRADVLNTLPAEEFRRAVRPAR